MAPRKPKDLEDQLEEAYSKADKPDKEAPIKLPKTLAACADLMQKVRQERLAAQKVVEALQKQESFIEEHLINSLPKSEATGVAGKTARATVVVKDYPTVTDWDSFYKYIKKTGSFELLQRRLSEGAIKERWEGKKTIPGVGVFKRSKISLTKV